MKNLLTACLLSSVLSLPLLGDMNDDPLRATFMAEKLEYRFNDEKVTSWDVNAYVGYDIDKIYLYSEGEKPKNGNAESENQLVYSRAITPFWDIQFGIDYDKTPESDKTWAVIAMQGLAPYFFETRAVILLADDGNIGFRFEAEYEALLTQKLILSPSLSTELYTKDAANIERGEGLSNISIGARLRYEFVREFAPYIGIERSKNFGNTDEFHPLDEGYVTAGLRVWF